MLAMFASIKVKPGTADTFEKLLGQLAIPTRQEPGTHLYVYGRAAEPDTFMMLERYDDKDALKAHYGSPHFKEYGPQLAACIDGEPKSWRFTEVAS